MKINWKQKLSSRKFWAAIVGVVVSVVAFTAFSPETTGKIVTFVGAIGTLVMYMLSEGIADNGRTIEK